MAEKSKVPAIDRMLDILDFVGRRHYVNFNEIIINLNLPKSSTYYMVDTLCQRKMLRKRSDGLYVLGLHVFELGGLASNNIDMRAEIRPFLLELTQTTHLVSHQAILEGYEAFYINKIESPERNVVSIGCSWEGKTLSFHNTALGKVLLAWQPESFIQTVTDNMDFVYRTETTIMNKADYIDELEKVRIQGWGFDNGEDLSEIRCIAMPIFNYEQKVTSAIGITGLASKFENEQKENLLDILKQTTNRISHVFNN